MKISVQDSSNELADKPSRMSSGTGKYYVLI